MNRFILYSTLFLGVIIAQEPVWPTDAGKSLKSNYGEFRHRHFHMGIDIKTGEKEGASVFAVEDGYVSLRKTWEPVLGIWNMSEWKPIM